MAEEHFRHLFLLSPPITHGFTSHQGRASPLRLPLREREAHASRLRALLTTAWQAAQGRQAVAHIERNGCYLEFAGAPDCDLALKSLENEKVGIRLLNVRTTAEGGQPQTF